MREIKFRAWLALSDYDNDGNDKDYYGMATKISVHYDGSIGFSVEDGRHIFDGDIFERALDNGNIDEYEDWVLWEGPCELMQYTGLKDKNGVEIYEGDILSGSKYGYGVVVWKQYQYLLDYIDKTQYMKLDWLGMVVQDGCEVIGNIYENPELKVVL